jgi:glycosyltransferase involved in cell wall biosynthesis
VLTVSEFTKNDIVDCYDVAPDKVVVTPNGVDACFTPDGPRYDGPPFLLFVGALQPRKNPVLMLEGFARLDTDLRLLMVGPEKHGVGDVHDAVTRLGLTERVEFLGHVEQATLASLYRTTECFVFPSSYEGFGLPVLEAMASGTPVVTSNVTSLPEIAGDAAVQVPLGDPQVLADGITTALNDADRLRKAGLARAALFTWQAFTDRTIEAYERVLA